MVARKRIAGPLKRMVAAAAVAVVGGYAAVVAALCVEQRHIMFAPPPGHPSPAEAGWPEAQEVAVDTADGERVLLWQVAPRGDKPVVLYFHGIGEIIPWRAARHRHITADGTGVVALSYRGYMGSSGHPTEDGLQRDAEAALQFARARYPSSPVVLWGHSLGTGVAVELAARHPVAKVILESPYSSAADVAARHYPLIPVRWLMLDQFHSDRVIGDVKAPLLIMHGGLDDVAPIAMGQRLFALAHEPKRFLAFPRGGHVDLDDFGATEAALAFIADAAP